jgi:hypothetical protein
MSPAFPNRLLTIRNSAQLDVAAAEAPVYAVCRPRSRSGKAFLLFLHLGKNCPPLKCFYPFPSVHFSIFHVETLSLSGFIPPSFRPLFVCQRSDSISSLVFHPLNYTLLSNTCSPPCHGIRAASTEYGRESVALSGAARTCFEFESFEKDGTNCLW